MKRLWWAGLIVGLSWALLSQLSCAGPVTLATFNIRMFPEDGTNRERVATLLAGIDADIIAVQEIRDEDALLGVLRAASQKSGREFRVALASCGGSANISTGLIYDVSRVTLLGTRQFKEHQPDDSGDCMQRQRAALLGVFEAGGETLAVLSVHMQHGHNPDQFAARRKQWAGVVKILQSATEQYGARVVALGDFNSTGFADEPREERAFIEETISQAGFSLATQEIPCTAYWRPEGDAGRYQPSILDHIVTGDDGWSAPEALGLCAELSCQVTGPEKKHPDYHHVSDHCPLRISRP